MTEFTPLLHYTNAPFSHGLFFYITTHTLADATHNYTIMCIMDRYRKIPSDKCEGGFSPPRRVDGLKKHCGNSSEASSSNHHLQRPVCTIIFNSVIQKSFLILSLSDHGLCMCVCVFYKCR